MRKLLLLTSVFVFTFLIGVAQDRTITGTVTSAEDGSAIPGVSVLVKGTATGAVTEMDGTYRLSVPSSGGTLVFSFIGMKAQEVEIGSRSTIDVAMVSDVQQLSEVVVTALNVPREKKTLGYATQSIDQENLRVARETNLNQALAGKVSGVQVISGSGAKFGEASIRIRGVRGLGGAAPIYVVDGIIISDPASINMDNVASINVLKGANAAALYGIRAVDGVIMITSKTAKAGEVTITANNSTTFERVATLLPYQNEYGGGYSDEFLTFNYNPAVHHPGLQAIDGANIPQFYADESWGPKMDGRQAAHWDAFYPQLPGFAQTRPWEPNPDNVKNFFNTGVAVNNSVSVGKAGEDYRLNMTITNIQRSGVLPNTNQDKTFFNLSTSVDLADNLTFTGRSNYNKTNTVGNFLEGYNGSIGQNVNQWFQRQLDMDLLREHYKLPNGDFTSWNINSPTNLTPLYWDNPFVPFLENFGGNERETFFGSAKLDWEIIDGLNASVAMTREARTRNGDGRIATGSIAAANDSYSTAASTRTEDYRRLNLRYNRQITNSISLEAYAGYEVMDRENEGWSISTNNGLTIPRFYNVSASTGRPNVGNFTSRLIHRSAFGGFNVGFQEIVYLDLLYRTDATSAIADPDRNKFNYFQASTSFIFSELMPSNDILSFGKFRASYAQTGKELSPYFDQNAYGTGVPYNGIPTMFEPNALIDPNISALPTLSYEAGVELKFLQNRLTADFSVYQYNTEGEPINIGLPGELGVTSLRTNDGKFLTTGWEASIGGTPIQTTDFNWNVNFNFATFKNEVVRLDKDGNLDAIALRNGFNGTSTVGGWGGIQAKAQVGEEWGVIIGNQFRRDDNGEIVVDADGFPLTDNNEVLGQILPDFTGGIFNSFNYKDFVLSFTIDWQLGGKVHSISRMFGAYSGLTEETVGLNPKGNPQRDAVAEGGGNTHGGVFEDGTPNDVYLNVQNYWGSLFALHEAWLYDATFVKLREVRLGYNLPSSFLDNTFIKNATVSFIANNPWLIYTGIDGIDPSEISGDTRDARTNAAWTESGNLPPTRSLGFDIKLGF